MSWIVLDGSPNRAALALLALASALVVAPMRRPRRVGTARRGRLSEPRRRALVVGAGSAAAGLLLAPAWWLLVLPVSAGVGLAAARSAGRPSSAERALVAGELAVRLDLVAACLRSGMGIGPALTAVHGVLPPPADVHGVLVPTTESTAGPVDPAVALHRVATLLALGADPSAAWRPATDCPDLVPVATAACRSALGGTVLVAALTEQAAALRVRVDRVGSQAAGRAGVLIAAPLGLCFLPSFLCLGLAPVVIGLVSELRLP